jgi:hypothetical protein
MSERTCVYCGVRLTGRRLKYCSDIHAYRYKCMNEDKVRPFSVAQHLRIVRAERGQLKGRVGCRFW